MLEKEPIEGTAEIEADGSFLAGSASIKQSQAGEVFVSVRGGIMPGMAVPRLSQVPNMRGTTSDGGRFSLTGPVHVRRVNVAHESGKLSFELDCLPQQVDVAWLPDATIAEYRYHIVNLEFLGNDRQVRTQTTPDGVTIEEHYLALKLACPVGDFVIHPLPDYEDRLRSIKARRGVGRTATGVIRPSPETDRESVDRQVARLLGLLSLARGTKINWIRLEAYSEQKQLAKLSLRNNVTRPFSAWPMVDSGSPMDTVNLVRAACSKYDELVQQYNFDVAIEMYLDAKNDNAYLESRALNAVALIDMLQSKFAETHNLGQISPDSRSFMALVKPVLWRAICALPNLSDEDRNEITGKIPELNRRSYRSVMKRWLNDLEVAYSDSELSKTRNSRNSLAHRLQFCSAADEEKLREYMRILGLLHRALLRLVGYYGRYLDFDLERLAYIPAELAEPSSRN